MTIDWDILPLHVKERIVRLLDDPSLVTVACVSRAWAETALAQKWSRISFTQLLRVFSSQTMLDVGPSTPMVRIWLPANGRLTIRFPLNQRFLQNPNAIETKRFFRYAKRVKELSYAHDVQSICHRLIEPTVIATLDACRPATMPRLFPDLPGLTFASSTIHGYTSIFPLLIGPALAELTLDYQRPIRGNQDDYYVALHSSLELLKRTASQLSAFVVKMNQNQYSVPLVTIFTRHVASWTSLRKLAVTLGGIGMPACIRALSTLRNLTDVELVILMDAIDLETVTFPVNAFPSLTNLTITSTISMLFLILHSTQSGTLRDIRIRLNEFCPIPTASLQQLVQLVCHASKDLHVFTLSVSAPESTRPIPNLPTATVFLPLLDHHNLLELVFEVGMPLQMTDADVDTMALVWPELRTLLLGVDDYSPLANWKPQTTCRAITSLLFHLTHLQVLGLEFNASSLDALTADEKQIEEGGNSRPRSLDDEPVRRSELEQLQVGWSLPGKPLNVACWISLMCPKLKDLTWHEAEGELEWRETKAMLETLTWLEG